MKIVFNRQSIADAIAPLMCAVSTKSTSGATEGILIEAEENSCVLTTFDEVKGLRTSVEAKIEEPGSYIINAQKFMQTLRVMEGETITLTVDDKLQACITSGKSNHRMGALVGSDFPAIPRLTTEDGFVIGQGVLKNMMSKVMYAMAVNDHRPVLNGCYFRITEGKLMVVACDSFKLAKCKRSAELVNKNTNGNAHLEYKFIVPAKTVNDLCRLLDDDDEAFTQIFVTRRHIVFNIGELTFFSRLLDGEYIDYDRIIVKTHKIGVTLNKDEFYSALERAALITEEKIVGSVRAHVKLDIKEDSLRIYAMSVAGSTYDEVNIEHEGDDILIAFNNRFLLDSVRSCSGEKIKLMLSSPLGSMNIIPESDEYAENGIEELYMLLPVRTKD